MKSFKSQQIYLENDPKFNWQPMEINHHRCNVRIKGCIGQ